MYLSTRPAALNHSFYRNVFAFQFAFYLLYRFRNNETNVDGAGYGSNERSQKTPGPWGGDPTFDCRTLTPFFLPKSFQPPSPIHPGKNCRFLQRRLPLKPGDQYVQLSWVVISQWSLVIGSCIPHLQIPSSAHSHICTSSNCFPPVADIILENIFAQAI